MVLFGEEVTMRKLFRILAVSASVFALCGTSGFSTAYAADEAKKDAKPLTGKDIAFDRMKGNCLACHAIAGGELPGNIGPALSNMKERYPDKAKLRAQIYDARVANPKTIMIPFGPMGVLTDEDIDKVADFISTL